MKTVLNISGMHCDGCVQRLTSALGGVPGVSAVRVTLEPPRAEVESSGAVSANALSAAAGKAGNYGVTIDDGSHAAPSSVAPSVEKPASLYPLVLIVGFIAGVCALETFVRGNLLVTARVAAAEPAANPWHGLLLGFMLDFMAGFFLVFSFFKLLDLRGFADAYQMYDVVARRARAWGFVYPFVEALLGVAYLVRWNLTITNWATLALCWSGSVGVLRSVLRKDRIRCACLGTALNLPMTTVTVVEDLGMAAMAGAALLWRH